MPDANTNVGQELLGVPFPEMIKSLGLGIAEAQYSLDMVGLRSAQMMSGEDFSYDEIDPRTGEATEKSQKGVRIKFDGEALSLMELGFTPNFYQFVDTIIEIKMSISMTKEESSSNSSTQIDAKARAGLGFFSASASASVSVVSASYASKYQYSAEGSNLMRTKLVPVPPPSILESRLRKILERKYAEPETQGGGANA